jgi:hypothetical protein
LKDEAAPKPSEKPALPEPANTVAPPPNVPIMTTLLLQTKTTVTLSTQDASRHPVGTEKMPETAPSFEMRTILFPK